MVVCIIKSCLKGGEIINPNQHNHDNNNAGNASTDISKESIKESIKDTVFLPGMVMLRGEDGSEEVLFAETDTNNKDIIGPGAIDPQDAPKLYKLAGGYTSVTYEEVEDNEYNELLRDRTGILKFYKMMDDDAVRNAFNYIVGAIRSMPYYIQYASEDPQDLEAAAFIADQLGIESSKAGKYPFNRLLRIFEHCLQFGAGYGEIVLKLVEGKGVLDTIIPYHPLVVENIVYDSKGGPKAVRVVSKIVGEEGKDIDKEIPIYKMVIFLNEDDGDLKGKSILRGAYVPYEIKRQMLILMTAGFERYLLGVPVITAPKGVTQSSPEWAIARQIGAKFAGNPKAGLTLPDGWSLDVKTVGSQMPDALPFVNMMNDAIARAMGVEFTTLGKYGNGNGGYGTSQMLGQLSERTIRGYIDSFVQYVNTYLIPKLMVVNYPNLTNYPVLTYSPYSSEVPTPLIQLVQQLMQMTMTATVQREKTALTLQANQPISNSSKPNPNSSNSKSKSGGDTALNNELNFADMTSTKSTPQDGAAGGFDKALFDQLIDALPKTIRDQLGYTQEKRQRLMSPYQTSTQYVYRKREY